MIRTIVIAVWVCTATVGALYLALSAQQSSVAEDGAVDPVSLKTRVLAIPIIENGAVDGYFLSQLLYKADEAELARITTPMEAYFSHVFHEAVYAETSVSFTEPDEGSFQHLGKIVADEINKRVGRKVIYEVVLDKIDYLSRSQ